MRDLADSSTGPQPQIVPPAHAAKIIPFDALRRVGIRRNPAPARRTSADEHLAGGVERISEVQIANTPVVALCIRCGVEIGFRVRVGLDGVASLRFICARCWGRQ